MHLIVRIFQIASEVNAAKPAIFLDQIKQRVVRPVSGKGRI